MRFLFFTDTHIRGTTPENRKDDFPETVKKKLNEVKGLVEELHIDYVLHGGDWFDRPDVSPAIVREFAMIFNQFTRPIITIAGNHDIYGQNPDSLGRTMLGLLAGIGVVKLLQNGEELLLEKEGMHVQITGQSYHYELDGENFKQYYVVKKKADVNFAIHIVHGMLVSKPFFEGIRYTLVKNIMNTEADITLAGHYHHGFGIIQRNGRYFINPGSIVRISNTLSEMDRKPKVICIDLGKEVHVREILLKSAAPGYEVLDRSRLELAVNRQLQIHKFYNSIQHMTFNQIEMKKIVEAIASDQKIGLPVREEALRRLGAAEEILASGDNQDEED